MSIERNILFETLLADLDDQDYVDLIRWEELKKKGLQINYIVDADVIHNYCFPRGINPKQGFQRAEMRNLSDEYIHDEQIALYILFHLNEADQKLVILNEYIPELKLMINAAKYFIAESNNSAGLSLETIHETLNETNDLYEIVKNHFSEIIVTVIEQMNGLDKFIHLLNAKTFILDSTDFNNKDLKKIFDENEGEISVTEKAKFYFDQFYPADVKIKINKDTDTKAISRTVQVNNILLQLKKKELFVFISDSKAIKNVFRGLTRNLKNYPIFENLTIPLFCSTQQYFAYLICRESENGKHSLNKTIENINQIRTANDKIARLFDDKFVNIISQHKKLFSNYITLRNQLENTRLFKNFDLIYSALEGQLKDNANLKVIKEFLKKLKNEQATLIKTYDEEHKSILERLEREAKFNASFLKVIENIKNGKNTFKISKGKDIIEGSYQLLPILLRFKNDEHQYNDYLFLLLELVLNKKIEDSKSVCEKMEKLLFELGKVKLNGDFPLEKKLIKILLLLLLPNSYDEGTSTWDSYIYDWICKNDLGNNIDDTVYSEYLYIACWISRRCGDFSNSIKYANEGIAKYRKDPRFYHGLFLAQYCLYYDNNDDHEKPLDEIINNANTAYYSYKLYFIENYLEKEKYDLISSRFEDCFNNNLCYFYAEKAALIRKSNQEEAEELLKLSRKKLMHLKKTQLKLPEYFETEAHLELIEASFNNIYDSQSKLRFALSAIEKALAISTNPIVSKKYFKTRNQIIRKLT